MAHYVPIMMNCEGQRIIIVGGGMVAQRKATSLLHSGAEIVVISEKLTSTLHSCYVKGDIVWMQRTYAEGDLEGAALVFAATQHAETNDAITSEALRHRIPVNHVGDRSRGNFITPSSVRRGQLIIAVSSSGAGPVVARQLCREIEQQYGDEYEIYIDFLSSMRNFVKSRVSSTSDRQMLFKLLAELDILNQIRNGTFHPWDEEQMILWIRDNQGV